MSIRLLVKYIPTGHKRHIEEVSETFPKKFSKLNPAELNKNSHEEVSQNGAEEVSKSRLE